MSLLRPAFTRQLAQQLKQGASINLISPHGQGRRRTLKDLRHTLANTLSILQMDMRDYPHDIKGMLNTLGVQAGLINISDMATLISQLARKSHHTLVIIHNFDLLHHIATLGHLNDIQKSNNISLLCVSEKDTNKSSFHADNLALPAINKEQLMAELEHRNFLSDAEKMADYLLQQSSPYSLLDELNLDLLSPEIFQLVQSKK